MKHDELAQYLDSLKREDCYRVDEVLKESAHETTQRVFFVGENGAENGPYIRKFIQQGSGLGSAYQRVYEAQRDGHRFKYIPDILECYARDGQLVVVVEYVRGDTLQEVVYQEDPSLGLARRVLPQICDAVTELHTEFNPPIIHRDLKPSNIVLTGQGLALIDFGISREYREQADCDTTHFGTREFAPPEQFGFGQTGVYSDVYSLGMVLYFCLTEQIPSSRARQAGFADPRIPECMRAVIERACALDPAMRFASASALKEAFLEAASIPVLSEPHGRDQAGASSPSSARRSPAKWVALGIVLIVCLAAVVGACSLLARGGDASGDSVQSDSVASSTASESSEAPSGSATEPVQASEVAESLGISSPPRDGFDSATNYVVQAGGVEFELPSYFKKKEPKSGDSTTYYYAETGSSVVMAMTDEWDISGDAGSDAESLSHEMDGFVSALMKTGEVFGELVSSTDCIVAGRFARVSTFRGTVSGLSVGTIVLVYYDPATKELGTIMFCQSANAQFDYSGDFAKVMASAKPVEG